MENLKQASIDTGCKFTKEELSDMLEEADINGDGVVDQDEFIKVMLQTNLF
jgi:Ca2+-binding EF-hand superfamily protein